MATTFTLNTGATIPAIGLGTWQGEPGQVKSAVLHAIKSGYRHIDAALMYQNEEEVGAGIREAIDTGVVKREDLFVTTKLWCTFHSRAEEGLDLSLQRLGLDYVDLFLMHWPVPLNPKGNHPYLPTLPDGTRDLDFSWNHIKTWKLIEELPKTGKTKAVGVANYSVKYLEALLPHATIVPAANQIENHPYLPQQEIVDFCKSKGILITAYSPFGSTGSPMFKDEVIQEIAKKHNVGPGTILLSYHIARGSAVIPKSVTPARIEENSKVVALDKDDVDKLESLHKQEGKFKRYVYPPHGVNLGFPDKVAGHDMSGL